MKVLTAAILGLFVGLITGFTIANSINGGEINALRGQVESSKKPSSGSNAPADAFTIGDDELKAKIAEADASPQNFAYQKNLGRALYRYATMKNDTALLSESARILSRANSLDPEDYDVLVDLGNAQFDIGYFRKDAGAFKRSRELYLAALDAKPDDVDVRTDLAISYLLDPAPELAKAEGEFQKAIKANPRQERALGFLVQTYIQLGRWADAEKFLEQLRSVNSRNARLESLASQITARTVEPIK